jgi:hypothetical protein
LSSRSKQVSISTKTRERSRAKYPIQSFIDAVEKNLYGFNWVCPDGGDECKYRHMLPAGFVL